MNRNGILVVRFFQYSFKKFPKLSYFFLLFFALNLFFIAIKLQVAPFFLYGMYSEKIPATSEFKTVSILVNGRNLKEYGTSYREHEFLSSALESYLNTKRNGGIDPVQSRVEARYGFLIRSSIYPLIRDKIFNPPGAVNQFGPWYRQRISRILTVPVKTVTIQEHLYRYDAARNSATHLKTEPLAQF